VRGFWRRSPDRGLAAAQVGGTVTLGEVDLPTTERRRLAEFGLQPGAVVTVVARTTGGGRLVGVGTGRVALDRRTSGRLGVREMRG
jgi:Fe2+ transport system protein FeoA